jgi:hypothetical protein
MKKLLCSYIFRGIFIYLALIAFGWCLSRAEPPSWLQIQPPAQPPTGGALAPPAAAAKTKPTTKKDIVLVRDTVEKIKVDTLYIAPPVVPKYKYKLQICNMDYDRVISTKINLYSYKFKDILGSLNNEEKMSNCYFSSVMSDSNYNYSYGVENLRTNGYIYDNYGNKLEQTEKVLVGVTLQVRGDNVKFDYLENKKLSLQNSFFANEVNFYANYTIYDRKCNFWVFCNYTERKQYLFLNLTREEM